MVGTNSYYVNYNDKGYLIDAPDGIGKWTRELKVEGYPLDYILLTHGHFDHVMGLEEVLSVYPEAAIYLELKKVVEKFIAVVMKKETKKFSDPSASPSLYTPSPLHSFIMITLLL